jgi:hypothetical protein
MDPRNDGEDERRRQWIDRKAFHSDGFHEVASLDRTELLGSGIADTYLPGIPT